MSRIVLINIGTLDADKHSDLCDLFVLAYLSEMGGKNKNCSLESVHLRENKEVIATF